jgi:hypothetical protein
MDRTVQLVSEKTGVASSGIRDHLDGRSRWTKEWQSNEVGTCSVPSGRRAIRKATRR